MLILAIDPANRLKNDATLAEIYAIAKYMEGEA